MPRTKQKENALQESLALANRSEIAMLGTVNAEGYPNIKAMLKMKNEGLRTIWFSTNTSSKRITQLQQNGKTCVYFVDNVSWQGLMLVGEAEVLQDEAAKQRLWRPGYEKYYPQGVTDPDYSVVRFTAHWGNYYHALANETFEIQETEAVGS